MAAPAGDDRAIEAAKPADEPLASFVSFLEGAPHVTGEPDRALDAREELELDRAAKRVLAYLLTRYEDVPVEFKVGAAGFADAEAPAASTNDGNPCLWRVRKVGSGEDLFLWIHAGRPVLQRRFKATSRFAHPRLGDKTYSNLFGDGTATVMGEVVIFACVTPSRKDTKLASACEGYLYKKFCHRDYSTIKQSNERFFIYMAAYWHNAMPRPPRPIDFGVSEMTLRCAIAANQRQLCFWKLWSEIQAACERPAHFLEVPGTSAGAGGGVDDGGRV